MGRAPCCDKANVKKGPWSPEEDAKLKDYIEKYGTGGNWIALPQKAGLKRCGKSCRLRWLNYLRPNIKHGEFSDEEDRIICTLFANIGSRWSIIAAQLPGRTDNDIKNYWNTKLKKKLMSVVHNSNNNNPSYNNIFHHKKFIANNPPTFTQNPSTTDLHESCTSSTNSSFSLSYQAPLLMPSSYYNTAPRSFSLGLEQTQHRVHVSNNFSNPSNSTYLNFQGVGHNSVQYYYPNAQDSINGATSNAFMFGSRSSEGSCSTSSDGSCNYQMMKQDQEIGFQYRQGSFMRMLYSNVIGDNIDDHHDRNSNVNLMWGSQTPLNDQDDHRVKQMMISDASNDYVLFNVDENKTQENKVVYF